MSKTTTKSGVKTINVANTMESIAPDSKEVFNKLWIYPSKGAPVAGLLSNANTGDVYLGERTDSGDVTPDLLGNADPPLKYELPQGEQKYLRDVLIQGANAGDGVWFKFWS